MMKTAAVLLLMGLATGMAMPAMAERVTLGNASFDLPQGWTSKEADGGMLLSRDYPETEDAEQAGAMIQLLSVSAAPAALEANISEMVSWVPETASDDPMIESAGQTIAGHPIRMEYRCCDHSKDVSIGQTVVGIAAEREQLLAGFIFVNTSSDHEDNAEADFQSVVRSVRFKGDEDGSLAPQPGDGGLEGAFTHLATGLMPNAFGGLDFQAESEVVLFDKAGLFSRSLPTQPDLPAHCATTPTDCGTYRLSGGGWFGGPKTIEMRSMINEYGVMETKTLPLGLSGDDLKIDDEDYLRLPPFAPGTRLSGTWTFTWASSGMTATTSGGVAVERTLVLDRSGRFTRAGWSGGSSSGEFGGVTVSGKKQAGEGTYEIAGHQLRLQTSDGKTQILSIFAPDRGSDELLVIDGETYLKDE